jgi:hypothetical protein
MWSGKSYSYVYKLINKNNSEYYIGLRSCWCLPEEDKKYYGSGKRIRSCIKKYGKEIFEKQILKTFATRYEASEYEKFLVTIELIKDPLCLNLKPGGDIEHHYVPTEEIKKKISEKLKKHYENPVNRKLTSNAIKKAYKNDPTYGEKISKAQKKKFEDQEYKKNVRDRIWENEEVKNKVIKALHGNEEQRFKSLKVFANSLEGKKQKSEATKGTIYISLNGQNKRVREANLNEFLSKGWELGCKRVIKKSTIEKLSSGTKGKKWMYNLDLKKNTRVAAEKVEEMKTQGWVLGWKENIKNI